MKIPYFAELKDCFSVVLGVDQVPRGKPYPDTYECFSELLPNRKDGGVSFFSRDF